MLSPDGLFGEAFANPADLDAIEIGCGTVLGTAGSVPALRRRSPTSARRALEVCLRGALAQPPCVVSFSGGRDSSALLALAAHVAQRERLAPPIALTLRFSADPGAEESLWQELVIGHVAPIEWVRVEIEPAAYDLAGPGARAALKRHGMLFPANAFFLAEMGRRAAGGSHVTGIGGDEMFDSPAPRFMQAAFLRSRPRLPDVKHALVHRRRTRGDAVQLMRQAPWLTPDAQSEAAQRYADAANSRSVLWSRAVRQWVDDRYYHHSMRARRLIAEDCNVTAVDPFYDPRVMTAIAAEAGPAGFRSRTQAMQHLFGDVLPAAVVERTTKARFTATAFGEHFREFVGEWDGSGLDESVVVPERLAQEWAKPVPNYRTALLLHQLLLRTDGSGIARIERRV